MKTDHHARILQSLRALCDREGDAYIVGKRAGVSGDNLRQVLQGALLKSGKPRGIGRSVIDKLSATYPGWLDLPPQVSGYANAYLPTTIPPRRLIVSDVLPLLPWESLVTVPVPEVFRAALVDDALSPDFPPGTDIVWTTRRRPAPGRIVLIKDRHGQLHARQCHQGREPGHWIAAPISPSFVAFDSREDGFELVAVYKGRLEPDDPDA